jgi:uncharacterized protein (DUF362 family)
MLLPVRQQLRNQGYKEINMLFNKSKAVSIIRCKESNDFDFISDAVSRALSLIGGLDSLICPGDMVLIKPNLVSALSYESGAVSNPYIIKALCRLAKEAGAGKLVIAEGSSLITNTMEAFEASGISRVAREEGAEIVDNKNTNTVFMGIPNGILLHRLQIPEVIMQADVIINVPVIKTHDVFPATLGLKNMKGVIQQKDKKRFHLWGLAQAIVDLNKLVLPQVTVYDGIIGMEGLGPNSGTPANLGIIMAAWDVVAGDTVASRIIGINPLDIEYLRLAGEQGLGSTNLSEIEVLGESIEEVHKNYYRINVDFAAYRQKGIKIYETGTCTRCRQVMQTILLSHLKDELNLLRNRTIIFGRGITPPKEIEGTLICFGSCAQKYRNMGEYLPGCPPHPFDVIDHFRNKSAV